MKNSFEYMLRQELEWRIRKAADHKWIHPEILEEDVTDAMREIIESLVAAWEAREAE